MRSQGAASTSTTNPVATGKRRSSADAVAAVIFQGRRQLRKQLSANRFVEAWTPADHASPPAFAASAASDQQFDAERNREDAHRQLSRLKTETLENQPQRLSDIKERSEQSIKAFVEGDHPLRDKLVSGIVNYISPDFPHHVLMNAIMAGHRELKDFLRSIDDGHNPSDERIESYCGALLDCHCPMESDATVDEVLRLVKEDLQDQTAALRDYLQNSVPLEGVTLAHGVIGHLPEEISVGVDAKEYVMSFLQGKSIRYNGVVSTTGSTEVARIYTADGDWNLDDPAEIIDVSEPSERRRAMLDKVSGLGDEIKKQALFHFFRCKDARGAWLPQNEKEMEVLLAQNHVVVPRQLIRGKDYFALVADITHVQDVVAPLASLDSQSA